MRSATVARWLQENANAPPPPATPAALPDDTASTVYPESSVSNPYASRYTGSRHRTLAVARVPQMPPPYLERRPSSAQGHHRDHYQQRPVPRQRHQSFSADSRYPPAQAQAYTRGYVQPQSNQVYYAAPAAATTYGGTTTYTRGGGGGHRSHQASQYKVVSSSPNRVEVMRPHDTRQQYTTYAAYGSTPTVSIQSRSTPKKAPLLRRLFGIEWGSTPPKSPRDATRHSSRSSSKSKSHHSDRDSYKARPVRPRRASDGVVYVRY